MFKAQLAATISAAMRHVITPPTVTWPEGRSASTARLGLSRYAPNVIFSVHVIHDNAPKSTRGAHAHQPTN
jgi:hypothetical protein